MTRRTTDRIARTGRARLADALTLVRLPLAVAIAGIVGIYDGLVVGAALLSAAWMTDLAAGRLARRAVSGTHFGPWDPIADATIGMGVLVGLVVSGRVGAVPWLALGALLFAAFIVTRNLAIGMVVQALAYGLFMVELAIDAPHALWMLGATAAVIGVVDAWRLVDVVLPYFFSGLGLSRRRRPSR